MIKAEYVDHMGDDWSVVDAARVSFDKRADQYTDNQNRKLIEFLAREGHELPFAHTAITLRCRAPIFVARQAYKSKIGFVENESSRRYVDDDPEFFMPDEWRYRSIDKKQGSGGPHPTWNRGRGTGYIDYIVDHYENCLSLYQHMIGDGVAPEQARMILPQSMMTEWIWTGSLLAYARFYNLRSKPDTQLETQQLAHEVGLIVSGLFPVSWDALVNAKRLEAVNDTARTNGSSLGG